MLGWQVDFWKSMWCSNGDLSNDQMVMPLVDKWWNGIAKLFRHTHLATGLCMKIPSGMPRLKGFRYPREIAAYAV